MIVVENHDYPQVALQLHFMWGAMQDPIGKEGLTYLTAQMLLRGTSTRTQAEFSEDVEVLGASVGVITGREFMTFTGLTLSRNFQAFVDLVGEAITDPAFSTEEFERLRRLVTAEIEERKDNDESLGQHLFYQLLYQPDPYSRPIKGTSASLQQITLDDIRECHKRLFTQKALLVAAAGAINEATLGATLQPWIQALPDGQSPTMAELKPEDPDTIKVVLIDKPKRTQTQIFGGHLGVPANHADRFDLLVGNTVFGGTFTARLCHEIREKRGWSYGAYSHLVGRRTHGSYYFRFYPAMKDAVAALGLGLSLQKQFVLEGATESEVKFAREYLVNNFPFRIETPQKTLQELVRLNMLGLPETYLETYNDSIRAVTQQSVNDAVRRHLKYEQLSLVMVCTAEPLLKAISELPGVGEVIVHPYDQDWPH